MQLSQALATINSSYPDTFALATCVSLGGTGLLVLTICVIMKYRLRRELLIAQDTLPRPFEIMAPAATTTSTWMRTRSLLSVPMPTVSPRPYPRNCRCAIRREGASARLVPLRAGSTPTSVMTTPSQSQPSSALNTRTQPYLSDTSLLSNHASPSSDCFLHRSRSHLHTAISLDPRSQSGSGAQSGQSSSSFPIGAQLRGAAGVSSSPSTSIHERRSAKRALWLSRSASELYCASPSASHNRLPGRGPYASSGGYTPPLDRHSMDTFVCPTNHLRQRRSASPMVHVARVRWDLEADLDGGVVFQHQDAGVIQELPPPYHKVVISS